MKEIKTERTVTAYDISYEAIDGTIFTTKEECEKYDKTAKAVLKMRFNRLLVDEPTNEWKLLRVGSEYSKIIAVKMLNKEDLDTVLKLWFAFNSHLGDESPLRKEQISMIEKAFEERDILLCGTGEEDNILYIIESRNSLVEKLNSLGKKDD